ncbi:RodZ domain-containing protein [Halomonas salinarum]|uniref:RodZ domain-containing protein n=1 Tax=Halomonas salinarum TaxID=1158993 RepID=UPI00143BB1FD|nr:RodZ domain-containing protein [Halomonas salinarum]
MSDMHDNDSIDTARPSSPGDILRGERENQGLSLDEVASSLNLRPAVVTGLEKDDYEQVPVEAYRRGYLRAYARLLGIDETGVLDAYRAANGGVTETERRVTPVRTAKPPSRLGAWLFKLVTLLVILGLIGLTLLWWQSRDGSGLPGIGDNEPVAVDTLDGTAVTDGSTSQNPTDSDTSAESGDMPPLPDEDSDMGLTDSQNDAQNASQDTGTSASDAGQSASDATSNEAGSDVAQADSAASSDTQSTDGADTASTESDAGPAVLELTFNEQSWTEIFDANDERIFVGLQSAGSTARAEGVPPFRLTVGNASGVEMRYRGETVDLTEYAGSNNVARFSLGE